MHDARAPAHTDGTACPPPPRAQKPSGKRVGSQAAGLQSASTSQAQRRYLGMLTTAEATIRGVEDVPISTELSRLL